MKKGIEIMLAITKKISKFNHSTGNNIKYIVIHDTGNKTDSAEANAKYFNECDRKASAHYFVDDKEIIQVVEENKAAWHVGDNKGTKIITNHNSIGIEMCRVNNDVTALTEQNTIELVKMLMQKYNVKAEYVVRHYDASRKNCPAAFSANNWERWNKFKAKLGDSTIPSVILKNGSKGQDVSNLQTRLQKLGYPIQIDGDFGPKTDNVVRLFQRNKGLIADGIVGPKTWAAIYV